MASRLDLQHTLEGVLGTRNVYFQPPMSLQMKFPCIRYELSKPEIVRADNNILFEHHSYTMTLIHKDPDNTIWEALLRLPYCRYDRMYKSDNLYHYVFTITI